MPSIICVIPHPNHRVGARLGGMRAHMIKSFLPRGFRKLDIGTDLAAENGLNAANKIADDTARTDRNAAYNAEMPDDLEAGYVICCRNNHGTAQVRASRDG
jgi:hypothetical protein